MKPILPSLREKKRYIGFEVISDKPLSQEDIKMAILGSAYAYIGDYGMAKAGMEIMEVENSKGIILVGRQSVDLIKASLSLITSIGNHKAIVKSVTTSGMLNKARKKTYGG